MRRAKETNKGAGKASTARSTMGVLLQVRGCKEDLIEEIVLELGSSSNVRWNRKSSVRTATAVAKPGIERAPHSG